MADTAANVAWNIRDIRDECFIRLELQLQYNELAQPEKASDCLNIVKERMLEVRRLDDIRDILLWIGDVYGEKGEKKQQIDYYEQALSKAEELDDLRSRYQIYTALAELYRKAGMDKKIMAIWKRVAAAAKEADNPNEMATASMHYGDAMARLHKFGESLKSYEEALRLAREIGDRSIETDAAYKLAEAFRSINDAERALEYCGFTLPFVEELGNLKGQIRIHNRDGDMSLQLARVQRVDLLLSEVTRLRHRCRGCGGHCGRHVQHW